MKKLIFLKKQKFTLITGVRTVLERVIFIFRGGSGGKIFRRMKIIAFAIFFQTFLGIGLNLSKWGKN